MSGRFFTAQTAGFSHSFNRLAFHQTNTLTTGIDAVTGTAGNDTINAMLALNPSTGATNLQTLTALDAIDGGAGNDTMNVQFTGAVTALPTNLTVNSVESINFFVDAAFAGDISTFLGVETVSLTQTGTAAAQSLTTKGAQTVSVKGGSTVAVTDQSTTAADRGAALKSVTLDGNTGAATLHGDGITTLSISNTNQSATVNAKAGTRELSVSLDKVTGGTITDAEATSVKIAAAGTASSGITLTTAKATSVNIDASAKLTIADVNLAAATTVSVVGSGAVTVSATTGVASLTSVSSVGSTGGLTITPALATSVVFTGGAGNDSITLANAHAKAVDMGAGTNTVTFANGATTVAAAGSVKGGTGSADTLAFATFANAVTATANTTLSGKASGFEVLKLVAANGTDGADVQVDNLNAADANNITKVIIVAAATDNTSITGLKNNSMVEVHAVQATDAKKTTIAVDKNTSADTVSVVLGTGLTTGVATGFASAGASNGIVVNGIETLNLVANPGVAATVGAQRTSTIDTFTSDTLSNINLSGTAFILKNAATTKAVTIDASALTGDGATTVKGLTLAGNLVAGSKVTGSDFVDTFTLGTTVGSTYSGGNGNDTFNAAGVANIVSGGVYNTIEGDAGTDTLSLTGATGHTVADSVFAKATGLNKLETKITAADQDVSITGATNFDKAFAAGGEITTLVKVDGTGVLTVDLSGTSIGHTVKATSGKGNATIKGGSGNDTITLTDADATGINLIVGGAGNDTITGSAVADRIHGSSDGVKVVQTILVNGTPANTNVVTSTLFGTSATLTLDGTTGATADAAGAAISGAVNTAFAGLVNTTFDTGTDTITINYLVDGPQTASVFAGSAGITFASAASASATIAQQGVNGVGGNDTINAGAGADVIVGGKGNDTLTGGAGNDKFVLNTTQALNGLDTITDFTTGTNTIQFLFGAGTGAVANNAALRGDGNKYLEIASGGTITGDAGMVVITNSQSDLSLATAKAVAEGLVGRTNGDQFFIALDNGTDTAIFRVSDTDSTIANGFEVVEQLVLLSGVSNASTTLSADNFVNFIA